MKHDHHLHHSDTNTDTSADNAAPGAALMSDGYTLKHAYKTAAGTLLTYVPTRRLTVKDLRMVRKQSTTPADWDDLLISAMTGLVPEDLDAMDLEDYQVLQKRFQSFAGLAA